MSILDNEGHDPNGLGNRPKPDALDLAVLQGLEHRAHAAEARAEDLRKHLRLALRQWHMYADMVEGNDGFNLATEKSPEGDLYREAIAAADA